MPDTIAGIDVHKRMLAVAIADVEVVGDFTFERRQCGSTPAQQLHVLAEWLVEEVVMESTAQYWKPMWAVVERDWQPPSSGTARAGGRAPSTWRRPNRTALGQAASETSLMPNVW